MAANGLFQAWQIGRDDAYNPLASGYRCIVDTVTREMKIQAVAENSQTWVDAIVITSTGLVTIPNLAP